MIDVDFKGVLYSAAAARPITREQPADVNVYEVIVRPTKAGIASSPRLRARLI